MTYFKEIINIGKNYHKDITKLSHLLSLYEIKVGDIINIYSIDPDTKKVVSKIGSDLIITDPINSLVIAKLFSFLGEQSFDITKYPFLLELKGNGYLCKKQNLDESTSHNSLDPHMSDLYMVDNFTVSYIVFIDSDINVNDDELSHVVSVLNDLDMYKIEVVVHAADDLTFESLGVIGDNIVVSGHYSVRDFTCLLVNHIVKSPYLLDSYFLLEIKKKGKK